jgi:GNAT superfamily N-acetyltransferase
MSDLGLAADRDAIARCFPVMVQLRPHLTGADAFVEQVMRQMTERDYKLAYLEQHGEIAAVAGFRMFECLAWGRTCYVDDLVTDEGKRSGGHGGRLLDWLVEHARAAGCGQFHLDSGVQRQHAHRFYFRKGMVISSFHFGMPV